MHRNYLLIKSNFVMTPKKYPLNLHTPKIFSFLKTPKNIEIQNYEPQSIDRAYVPWGTNGQTDVR